ncbi:MAG TPA: O-antigen ligase family protein [Nitratifractor sp.]|nr:O-antigen ligase family protein [Nitratifractor sp.]HHH20785.1 O-antigen ligase family protein [Nitratifractor sp.]
MLTVINKINFQKTYHYLLLLFAFTLPLSRALNSISIALLLLLLLLQGNYKVQFARLKESPFAMSILAFISYTILSLLWTQNLKTGLNGQLLYLYWLAIFAIALNVKKEDIHLIIKAFILGMVVSEILSYGMFFGIWEINGHGKEYPSPFMMHIDYSIFLAFTAIVLLNRLLSNRYTKKEKAAILFFFLTICGNLFINEGRTGQVALAFGIFAVAFIHFKLTLKSFFLSVLLLATILLVSFNFIDKFHTRVLDAKTDIIKIDEGKFTDSLGQRVAMYIVAADIVEENPFIGVGVGDYKDAAAAALEKNTHGFSKSVVDFIPKNHFHSQYLNVLVQGGIIGLALLLWLFYQFAKLPIEDPELKELSILAIVVLLAGFLPEPLLLKQFTNNLFILFAGLFLGASLQEKPTPSNKQSRQKRSSTLN